MDCNCCCLPFSGTGGPVVGCEEEEEVGVEEQVEGKRSGVGRGRTVKRPVRRESDGRNGKNVV